MGFPAMVAHGYSQLREEHEGVERQGYPVGREEAKQSNGVVRRMKPDELVDKNQCPDQVKAANDDDVAPVELFRGGRGSQDVGQGTHLSRSKLHELRPQ